MTFIEALRAEVARLAVLCEQLEAKERALIADAARTKSYLPDNYWKERHHAQRLHNAASNLLTSFEGDWDK